MNDLLKNWKDVYKFGHLSKSQVERLLAASRSAAIEEAIQIAEGMECKDIWQIPTVRASYNLALSDITSKLRTLLKD